MPASAPGFRPVRAGTGRVGQPAEQLGSASVFPALICSIDFRASSRVLTRTRVSPSGVSDAAAAQLSSGVRK